MKLSSVLVGRGLRLPKSLLKGETPELKQMVITMHTVNEGMHFVNN
jgi:hypothetical protein